MKRLLMFLFAIVALSSCYEDKSASDYAMINSIIIDNAEESMVQQVYQLDSLTIRPIVYKEGLSDDNFAYTWTLSGNYMVPEVIGTAQTLKAEINEKPSDAYYDLVYRVEDLTTGIFVEKLYQVKVLSPYDTGILVADTRDELTSDVSLIMSKNFKYSYTSQDTVIRDIYTRVQGYPFSGVIKSMQSMKYGAVGATLLLGSDNTLERFDPYDFTYIDRDGEAFLSPLDAYDVIGVVDDAQRGYDIAVINGQVYARQYQWGETKFAKAFKPYSDNQYLDYSAAMICKPYWTVGMVFDEQYGRFFGLDCVNRIMDKTMGAEDYSAYDCLSMFNGYDNYGSSTWVHCILKHKDTGEISNAIHYSRTNSYQCQLKLHLEYPEVQCPNIKQATAFAAVGGVWDREIVYYGSGRNVYVVNNVSGLGLETSLQFTAPEGEEVTGLLGYCHEKMSGRVDVTDSAGTGTEEISAWNRMLLVTTYNSSTGEGFIRTIAISNQLSGALEQNTALHKCFDGFGRITKISIQQ